MEVTKALITRNFTYLHSKNIFSNTSKQKWRWKQSSSVSIESFDHTASAGKRNIFVTYVQKIIRRYLKVIIGGLCSSELHFPITNDFEAKKLSFDSGGKKKTVALLPTIANNCMIAIMNTSKIFKSWEWILNVSCLVGCWFLASLFWRQKVFDSSELPQHFDFPYPTFTYEQTTYISGKMWCL